MIAETGVFSFISREIKKITKIVPVTLGANAGS